MFAPTRFFPLLKSSQQPIIASTVTPVINWLAEAGFGTDTPVTVAVEQGQLVIRPAE
ncbi:SymE family type I addiction module toxin [Serratia rubidaea]|uniref:SymE family type I addiction module toxin n=1 Tax=Serratia rubidaea TaxID=61652 RepID=A0ABS0MG91_SERRU|nr:SymE family type I addiction module toxin [Serratia rubidaea]